MTTCNFNLSNGVKTLVCGQEGAHLVHFSDEDAILEIEVLNEPV